MTFNTVFIYLTFERAFYLNSFVIV